MQDLARNKAISLDYFPDNLCKLDSFKKEIHQLINNPKFQNNKMPDYLHKSRLVPIVKREDE